MERGRLLQWLRALGRGDLTIRAAAEDDPEIAAALESVRALWGRERQRSLEQTAGAIAQVTEVYERERKLLEVIADGLLVADADGCILRVNETMLGWLGLDVADAIGAQVTDLLRGEPGWLDALVASTVSRDLALDIESRHATIPTNCTGSVTKDHRGHVREIVLLARDVREAKRAEAVKRQLIHADRLALLGTMAASVAHEINNPACYVLANLQYGDTLLGKLRQGFDAMRGSLPPDVYQRMDAGYAEALSELRDMARENTQGIERIARIVKDLRSFSRGEQAHPEEVAPTDEINAAINMVANRIAHRGELVRNMGSLPPIFVRQGQLAQVAMNLLVNAADAIEEAGPGDHRIEVTTRHEDGWVTLEVSDTGAGIPEEIQPRVFDQFFTTKPVGQGTGLGLSLCADIVHEHGGEIDFESLPERGARFTVRLPVGSPRDDATVQSAASQVEPTGASGARILLVDDEPLVLKSMRRALSPYHEVTCVRGGQQALDALSDRSDFDLILCDMMMPGIDGVDVFHHLETRHPAMVDKMVFCTGGAFTKRVQELLDRTDNRVLSKPIDIRALHALVDEVRDRPAAPHPAPQRPI